LIAQHRKTHKGGVCSRNGSQFAKGYPGGTLGTELGGANDWNGKAKTKDRGWAKTSLRGAWRNDELWLVLPTNSKIRVCCSSQAWWHVPVIPALRKLKQEDHKFKVSLGL
jgi:hypothetical protein